MNKNCNMKKLKIKMKVKNNKINLQHQLIIKMNYYKKRNKIIIRKVLNLFKQKKIKQLIIKI